MQSPSVAPSEPHAQQTAVSPPAESFADKSAAVDAGAEFNDTDFDIGQDVDDNYKDDIPAYLARWLDEEPGAPGDFTYHGQSLLQCFRVTHKGRYRGKVFYRKTETDGHHYGKRRSPYHITTIRSRTMGKWSNPPGDFVGDSVIDSKKHKHPRLKNHRYGSWMSLDEEE